MADPRSTQLIDNFLYDPETEDPLRHGGRWAMAVGITRSGDDLDMRKFEDPVNVQGHATQQSHGTTLSGPIGRSFYRRRIFEGDTEVWGYPYGGQLGAALETWRLFLWSNPIWNPTGYLVYIGGGIGKDTVLRKYDSASSWSVLASHGSAYSSGLMLRTIGDQVEVWACNFGDDPDVPANWYQRIGVTDTTYRGPWYLGMAIEDPSNGGLSFTGIGGGKPTRQQIYRYVKPPVDKGRELTP